MNDPGTIGLSPEDPPGYRWCPGAAAALSYGRSISYETSKI